MVKSAVLTHFQGIKKKSLKNDLYLTLLKRGFNY